MRWLLPAALLAASAAAAQEEARWGPVADTVGLGTAICTQEDPIICAAVLCRDARLSVGLMGVEYANAQPAPEVGVEVDGEMFRREMTAAEIDGDVLHIGSPITVRDALWRQLRAGSAVRFHDREGQDAREFSLAGSAAELDRVARGCR